MVVDIPKEKLKNLNERNKAKLQNNRIKNFCNLKKKEEKVYKNL